MNIIIYLVPDHTAIKKFQLFDDSDTGVLQPTLRKIPKFQGIFCCGNFAEKHSFLRKLYGNPFCTKFPYQEIR